LGKNEFDNIGKLVELQEIEIAHLEASINDLSNSAVKIVCDYLIGINNCHPASAAVKFHTMFLQL